MVAPFAGAWIEMQVGKTTIVMCGVAPFAGAWIEISSITCPSAIFFVAPFAGAWIEIARVTAIGLNKNCRSLRGSVD